MDVRTVRFAHPYGALIQALSRPRPAWSCSPPTPPRTWAGPPARPVSRSR